MKSLNKMTALVLILVSLLAANWASAAGVGNNIAVRLVGTATAYGGDDLFEEFGLEPQDAACFDVDLVMPRPAKSSAVPVIACPALAPVSLTMGLC